MIDTPTYNHVTSNVTIINRMVYAINMIPSTIRSIDMNPQVLVLLLHVDFFQFFLEQFNIVHGLSNLMQEGIPDGRLRNREAAPPKLSCIRSWTTRSPRLADRRLRRPAFEETRRRVPGQC